jgi:hypothetical protein
MNNCRANKFTQMDHNIPNSFSLQEKLNKVMSAITSTSLLRGSRSMWLIGLCIIPIFLVRLAFPSPMISPDSKLYLRLASNLIDNHCYSDLELKTAKCIPTWGSSQPPGYPVFIAMVRLLFVTDPAQVVLAQNVVFIQTALFALAAVSALWASYSWHKRVEALLGSLIIITFSPITIAWPRWVLTETLAAAAGLLVLTALFRSLKAQKMNVILTGLAIAGATFIRWDLICLLVPSTMCAFYLSGFSKGLRHAVIIGAITALPILAMIGRAGLVGLPLLPSITLDRDLYLPKGVFIFYKKAAITKEAMSGFVWPMLDRTYEGVAQNFNYNSISSSFNTVQFRTLMDRISELPSGSPLPADMNAELIELAGTPKVSGIGSTIYLILQRALKMWTGKDPAIASSWNPLALEQMAESLSQVYRIVLILVCLILLFRTRGKEFVLLVGLLTYVVVRTLFLASLVMLEIRYLMPMFPVMEIVIASLVFKGKRRTIINQP